MSYTTATLTLSMRILKIILAFGLICSFAKVVKADPAPEVPEVTYTTLTPTTTTRETSIWATGTDDNGITVTTESIYTQKFSSMYTSVAVPSSGSIGLGTIQGTVGVIRTDRILTTTRKLDREAIYAPMAAVTPAPSSL